jgi:hypothetical protein
LDKIFKNTNQRQKLPSSLKGKVQMIIVFNCLKFRTLL